MFLDTLHIRIHGVLEALSPRKVDVPVSIPAAVMNTSSFQDILVVDRFLVQMKICKNRENLDLDGRRNQNATWKVVFYIFDKIVLNKGPLQKSYFFSTF